MSGADGPNSADRRFYRTAMQADMLDADKERELARRWRVAQDIPALHSLTGAYVRLVLAIAGKYRAYGLPAGDLVQEGCIGLMQAAFRFDPDRGVRFSTYATWWVHAQIKDFILRNWSIVRMGSAARQRSLFFRLRRLRQRIGADATVALSQAARADIARNFGVSPAEVERMEMRLSAGDRSLNSPITEDAGTEWQDLLADERPLPDEQVAHSHDSRVRAIWIAQALDTLTPRELAVIRARRLSEEGITLEELGARLGITKERVRQIEQNGLRKLRTRLLPQVSGESLNDPGPLLSES